MLDVRERTRLRRVLYAKPTIILFAFLVALMLHGVWGIYQKSQEAVAKRDKAVAELAGLATREKELREDIARLSTGDGLEAEIRDRLMVAKEGEKVMIIADPDATKVHTVTVDENSPSLLETMMSAVGLGRK